MSNDATASLEKQLHSCRSLLNVFQKERRLFLSKSALSLQDVMPLFQLKKRLLDVFESHRIMMKKLEQNPGSQVEEESRRELLRELGTILEQLLVIDRENELLMRKLLDKNNEPAQNAEKQQVKEQPRKKVQAKQTGPVPRIRRGTSMMAAMQSIRSNSGKASEKPKYI